MGNNKRIVNVTNRCGGVAGMVSLLSLFWFSLSEFAVEMRMRHASGVSSCALFQFLQCTFGCPLNPMLNVSVDVNVNVDVCGGIECLVWSIGCRMS